jgi:hypothetical protein
MPYKFNIFTGTLDIVNASSSGSGNVTGVPPTNIGAIARWADTTGTTIENSPNTNVQDGGAIEAQGFITEQNVIGLVSVNQDECWIAPALNITLTGSIDLSGGGSLRII